MLYTQPIKFDQRLKKDFSFSSPGEEKKWKKASHNFLPVTLYCSQINMGGSKYKNMFIDL